MPKLLYTWYFEKFTASVTSSGHSALRHDVSRICTILFKFLKEGCASPSNVPKLSVSGVNDTAQTSKDLSMSWKRHYNYSICM